MPFQIVHNDITKMHTDAIVNAANSRLQEGGGVCGAIFAAAGSRQLAAECSRKSPCPTGGAVVTGAYGLPAKYIIHAVGPIWRGGGQGEEAQLRSAYLTSLKLAEEKGCRSISFPLISSGIYGYPKEQALQVAVSAFSQFLTEQEEGREMDIYLAVFDRSAVSLSEKLFQEISHYIGTYYEEDRSARLSRFAEEEFSAAAAPPAASATPSVPAPPAPPAASSAAPPAAFSAAPAATPAVPAAAPLAAPSAAPYEIPACPQASFLQERSLEDLVNHLGETFSAMVLRLTDEKGFTDAEVYKRANLDRKHFSKIRNNPDYCPKKSTALALALGLRLSLDETLDLLGKAGYTLSNSSRTDVILRYFLERGEHDIFLINEALFCFGESTLGSAA